MEVSNLIIEMNQRAFLTAPPRMNLLEYPLDYLPMEAHQLQLLTSFSVHGAPRARRTRDPLQHASAPAACRASANFRLRRQRDRSNERERERGVDHARKRGSEGRVGGIERENESASD